MVPCIFSRNSRGFKKYCGNPIDNCPVKNRIKPNILTKIKKNDRSEKTVPVDMSCISNIRKNDVTEEKASISSDPVCTNNENIDLVENVFPETILFPNFQEFKNSEEFKALQDIEVGIEETVTTEFPECETHSGSTEASSDNTSNMEGTTSNNEKSQRGNNSRTGDEKKFVNTVHVLQASKICSQ